MSRRSGVFAFLACFLAVVGFQWVGLVLSFADFHPGGDVAADPEVARRAELGAAMHRPFRVPLEWMRLGLARLPGGGEFVLSAAFGTLFQWVHGLVLPLIYGTMLFVPVRWLVRCFSSREGDVS